MVPRPDEVTDVMEQRGHDVLDRASVAERPRACLQRVLETVDRVEVPVLQEPQGTEQAVRQLLEELRVGPRGDDRPIIGGRVLYSFERQLSCRHESLLRRLRITC